MHGAMYGGHNKFSIVRPLRLHDDRQSKPDRAPTRVQSSVLRTSIIDRSEPSAGAAMLGTTTEDRIEAV